MKVRHTDAPRELTGLGLARMTRVTPPALNGDKLCAKETGCVRGDTMLSTHSLLVANCGSRDSPSARLSLDLTEYLVADSRAAAPGLEGHPCTAV